MQPTAAKPLSRLDRRLASLRDHPVLGTPIRFYLRRREQILYLVVGAWNTLFGYGIWALLQSVIGDRVHYLVVVLIAWPLALLNAYFGYRWFVFRSHGSILRELPRFSLVYFVTLLVNLALLPIALSVLPFNIYLTQLVLLAIVVVASYLSNKYFSFGGGRDRYKAAAAAADRATVSKDS